MPIQEPRSSEWMGLHIAIYGRLLSIWGYLLLVNDVGACLILQRPLVCRQGNPPIRDLCLSANAAPRSVVPPPRCGRVSPQIRSRLVPDSLTILRNELKGSFMRSVCCCRDWAKQRMTMIVFIFAAPHLCRQRKKTGLHEKTLAQARCFMKKKLLSEFQHFVFHVGNDADELIEHGLEGL